MNEIKNYAYIENLELSEYIAFPIYIIIILLISFWIQNKNIKNNPVYRYYTIGVAAKLLGAVAFCLVYIFVYKGGDTISYFETSRALTKLLYARPGDFLTVITETPSRENFYFFDGRTTGYPWWYMYLDSRTFLVTKLLVPFMILSFQSYMLCTILLSWASFAGIWRLYLVFTDLYKNLSKPLAYSVLFLPSAVFWGSGILKDTITLSASCWFIYVLYMLFIKKERKWQFYLGLFFCGYIILVIKPYILFALLPGAVVWIIYSRIVRMRSNFLRYSIIPFIFLISFGLGYAVLAISGGFKIESLINEASVKQNDLKRADYNGNSFDIGTYEPTIDGALSVAPSAVLAGLYRPFVWEARNVVMIFSGFENFLFLVLSVLLVIRLKFRKLFRVIAENPFILFSLSYSILFALIIGLSTSNFGALVRFKIAFLPVFVSSLVVLFYQMKSKELKK
ncbi:MAG: hypothetical protein M3R27_12460 [Bacteroidota bacterium]|nr:hypothetical protein [Bacteroidota bacterium]